MSAADGSCGLVSESVNGKPARLDAGAEKVAVGGTFCTSTVVCAVAVCPTSSVTCTRTTGLDGPSPAEKLTLWPGVSKLPLLSRSQA